MPSQVVDTSRAAGLARDAGRLVEPFVSRGQPPEPQVIAEAVFKLSQAIEDLCQRLHTYRGA